LLSNDPLSFDAFQHIWTQIGTNAQFDELTKGGDYLGRLQLYTKGKAVNKKLIPPGHYGIPESDTEVTDLGDCVNVLPLARRPKAIVMNDASGPVVSFDMRSKVFQRIAEEADEGMPNRQFGIEFLVYERTTRRFLVFYCGTKSTRKASRHIFPYLPLLQGDIDALAKAGRDVTDLRPRGPIPITLAVSLAKNNNGSWHVPVIAQCFMPFSKLPSEKMFVTEVMRFITPKDTDKQ
jgi:hypothetical protein